MASSSKTNQRIEEISLVDRLVVLIRSAIIAGELEPDAHIGLEAFGWMTRGQELSLPMIAVGIALLWVAYRGPASQNEQHKVKT